MNGPILEGKPKPQKQQVEKVDFCGVVNKIEDKRREVDGKTNLHYRIQIGKWWYSYFEDISFQRGDVVEGVCLELPNTKNPNLPCLEIQKIHKIETKAMKPIIPQEEKKKLGRPTMADSIRTVEEKQLLIIRQACLHATSRATNIGFVAHKYKEDTQMFLEIAGKFEKWVLRKKP